MAATLIVKHKVDDYATWRPVYDSVGTLRKQHGCTDAEVLRDPDDTNDLIIFHRFPTLDQAQAFAGSDELHEAIGRSGVVGEPRIEFAVEA
jgi:heme-degrading monooxygenase HmoA